MEDEMGGACSTTEGEVNGGNQKEREHYEYQEVAGR
jgi:hypothetical protein